MQEIKSAPELIATEGLVREWAVRDFVPLGSITVIAGKKGKGKSVMALHMAHAVATGRSMLGRRTNSGEVLYIGTEDDEIELRDRYRKLLAFTGDEPAADLDLKADWPKVKVGGQQRISEWLENCEKPRMVIVDVVTSVHPEIVGSSYARTYPMVESWVEIARKYNIALVLVTHMYREWRSGDWRDAIVGSVGFIAAAQTVFGIFGEGPTERVMYFGGKAVREDKIALTINGGTMEVSVRNEPTISEAPEITQQRAELIRLVRDHPGLKAREYGKMLPHRSIGSTVRLLQLMADAGQLATADRRYSIPGASAQLVLTQPIAATGERVISAEEQTG